MKRLMNWLWQKELFTLTIEFIFTFCLVMYSGFVTVISIKDDGIPLIAKIIAALMLVLSSTCLVLIVYLIKDAKQRERKMQKREK